MVSENRMNVGRIISVGQPPRWLYVKSEDQTKVFGYLFADDTKRWIAWTISYGKSQINEEPHAPIKPRWVSEANMLEKLKIGR